MTALKILLDARAMSPQTAAAIAGVNIHELYDALGFDDDIMMTWTLRSVFALSAKLDVAAAQLIGSSNREQKDPQSLHAALIPNLEIPEKANELAELCGWEISLVSDYYEWVPHVCDMWCPEELKDVCDGLELGWLPLLNGLQREWKRVSGI